MSAATVTELDVDTGRDPAMEAWLDERHATWTFHHALALDDVDQAASRANQARLEALDDDVVDRYAAAMQRGDRFPPVLGLRRKRRKVLLLGGNHRYTAAARAGLETIPAYVVDAEPEMATRLMYEDNRRHGLPPSDNERIAQAVHLMDQGWTQEAAAECVGISAGKVNRARGTIKADQRAKTLQIEGWEQLPKTSRWRLSSVRSDPVFVELANLVIAARLTADGVFDLVTRVNDARSDADALNLIGTELEARRADIQTATGGHGGAKKPTTPRARMLGAIAHLGACDPDDVAASCANADQAASLDRMILDVAKRLQATRAALKARW